MWDIKLLILDVFFITNLLFFKFLFFIINSITPLLLSSFSLINWQLGLILPQNLSLFFGIKFCICISFLILIRGGTPRYRYDFLTKLGWLKFLSLILLVLTCSICLYFLY